MTLGFSVEALAPVGRGGGALRMGLRSVAEGEWLHPAPDLAVRAAVFDNHPEAVQMLAGAEAASREVAAMLGVDGGVGEAARACWEDLCLLLPDADGAYRLVAGAVAFPTDWRLADKVGLPLTAIHAPIHGYAEQLAAGVDHFFRTLPPGPIFGRANWFVVPTDAWRYLPDDAPADRFAHVTAANAGQALFVRCERQTLRRLPASGRCSSPSASTSPGSTASARASPAASPMPSRMCRRASTNAAPPPFTRARWPAMRRGWNRRPLSDAGRARAPLPFRGGTGGGASATSAPPGFDAPPQPLP